MPFPLKDRRPSTFARVLALSLLAALSVGETAIAQQGQPIEIGRGVLDHDRDEGQRWKRIGYYSPPSSSTYLIRVFSEDGDVEIRFSVFSVTAGGRIGTTYRSTTPNEWVGWLEQDQEYYVAAWSTSGSGTYRATIESTGPALATAAPSVVEEDASLAVAGDDAGPVFTGPMTTAAARTWSAEGEVHRVATVGDTLFVGGEFTRISSPGGNSLRRTYLAAFDRHTGQPTDFAPELDGAVRALAVSSDERILYVGGAFLNAEGKRRNRVAAFDLRTGRMTAFDPPAPNQSLRAIAIAGDRIYLGGLFTRIGDRERPYVAAFDAATGALDTDFAASPDAAVKALVAGPEGLWIGGDFRRMNRTAQRGIGLVSLADGSLQATDDVTAEVIDLAASNSQLFIAVGGPGGRAVAFDRSTGVEQWTIASDGNFQAVGVDGGRYVYFGGHYEIVEGNRDADRMTRHDKLTGRMDRSWLPRINGIRSVNAVDVRLDGVYIGGDFTKVDLKPQEGFAIFPGSTE